MFGFRNIPPEDARTMYDASIWDDATMSEWMRIRSDATPEQIKDMLDFMKQGREQ